MPEFSNHTLALGILSVFLSMAMTSTFILIRSTVKSQRQDIIRDLEAVFQLPSRSNEEYDILPSFEFVKYKYFFRRRTNDPNNEGAQDFKFWQWMIAAAPLVVCLSILNYLALAVVSRTVLNIRPFIPIDLGKPSDVLAFIWVGLVAYVGAFLFMSKSFFRAINNFDLSHSSFLGATINLLFGVLIAQVMYFGLIRLGEESVPVKLATAAVIVTAFAAGYFPDLAYRNLIRASRLRFYKKEQTSLYSSFEATPIEVIDGIDTEIRDRLPIITSHLFRILPRQIR